MRFDTTIAERGSEGTNFSNIIRREGKQGGELARAPNLKGPPDFLSAALRNGRGCGAVKRGQC